MQTEDQINKKITGKYFNSTNPFRCYGQTKTVKDVLWGNGVIWANANKI